MNTKRNDEKIAALVTQFGENIKISKSENENFLYEVKNDVFNKAYYIYTKEELADREFETFESCYYGEIKTVIERSINDFFDSNGNSTKQERILESFEHRTDTQTRRAAKNFANAMITDSKTAFEKSEFLETATKQYKQIIHKNKIFFLTEE